MALIDDMRGYLRIDESDTSFDTEIQDLINAAQTDLLEVGLSPTMVSAATDPLIKRAIVVYAKANFGYDTDNMPGFTEAYESLKVKLMNTADYQAVSS